MIYNAIKESQNMLDDLAYSMRNIESGIDSIFNNTKLSSYYSRMSTEDTRVLTYINLMR